MPDEEVMNKACHRIYLLWERIIKEGNIDYEANASDSARLKYIRAIELATDMVNSEPCIRPTVGALLVSYHNLADLYERDGHVKFAYHALVRASQHIEHLAQHFPTEAVPVWGKRIACEQLYLFSKRHGDIQALQRPAYVAHKPNDSFVLHRPLH